MRKFEKASKAATSHVGIVIAAIAVAVGGSMIATGCSSGPSASQLATYDSKPTKLMPPPNMTTQQRIQWIQSNPNLTDQDKQLVIARLEKTTAAPLPKPAGL